jgi:glycosyltransferase involved in cell wall biosynthesis
LKKNNILIIGQFTPPINGCSLANEVLVKQLKAKEIQFSIINTSTQGFNDKALGQFSFSKVTPIFKQYKNIFKIRNSEIVYTTPGQTFFGILKYAPFYLASIFFKVPYIIHVHGNFLGKQYQMLPGWKRLIFKYLVSNASHGIVLSESLKPIFNDLLDVNQVSVIGNFAEDYLISTKSYKNTDCIKILFLSNLIAYKGIFEILEAAQILKTKGINFELHLAGGLDVSIEEELLSKIKSIPEAKYYGIVSGEEKKKLLESSNVFCLPTYYEQEGQPISLLEAMLTGNIVVTTKHAGIPDIVSEKNGYFCEKKSAESLANILIDISENLTERVNLFSEHNKSYILNNYTEKIFSDKLISLFNEVARAK